MTLNVILLEDNNNQLMLIRKILLNRIKINPTIRAYDMKLDICTTDPNQVLNYIKRNLSKDILAILDIDLQNKLSGIKIAKEIRSSMSFSEICYVTANDHLLLEAITENTAPLDFITKNMGTENMINQLRRAIDLAYNNYTKLMGNHNISSMFTYEPFPNILRRISVKEILFIKTTTKQHRLQLICKEKIVEFQGELKKIELKNPNFLRADRQILINPDNVVSIDIKQRRIYFETESSKEIYCKVSLRRLSSIRKKILNA
ncbi:LytR/AlgR family response regulator transcription factor [Limosilactobacillus reuteri]|uniref:LytR/AlgR family response regulator transcription factor n=1 Tax=Limosilactobacillus reuteri TaxID=1598 RepID=UPI001E584773|nr:LytTR family transcriptional regulator DNA-binding domain-containing protein [Limosilactobacillus reuteri]MCC4358756.1 LytTR family transcriptional regulator DNA-binding domain-containing protein [Limosilactobacillus reuteri]MCC4363424.1 LytTR family transcriptional regulator DNA-binding domain-containing protein [Limosilactobacillus reuteri]MCC4365236.1 LytTR family transcriptional regulator DNA-binding domain-containing protein [Limosilactobacillus reuteri]